jgi:hypothetical protein
MREPVRCVRQGQDPGTRQVSRWLAGVQVEERHTVIAGDGKRMPIRTALQCGRPGRVAGQPLVGERAGGRVHEDDLPARQSDRDPLAIAGDRRNQSGHGELVQQVAGGGVPHEQPVGLVSGVGEPAVGRERRRDVGIRRGGSPDHRDRARVIGRVEHHRATVDRGHRPPGHR